MSSTAIRKFCVKLLSNEKNSETEVQCRLQGADCGKKWQPTGEYWE